MMHPFRLSLCVLCLTAPLALATALGEDSQKPTTPKLLEFLVAKIEQQRAAISSVSFSAHLEQRVYRAGEGWLDITNDMDVLQRGRLRAATRKDVILTNGSDRQEHVTRGVINDQYVAHKTAKLTRTFQIMHDSIDSMSREGKAAAKECGVDLLQYGYGNGDAVITSDILAAARISRWEVNEVSGAGGGALYEVICYPRSSPTAPESRWTVDPQQGYMVTKACFFDESGNMLRELTVTPTQTRDGYWIPAKSVCLDYVPGLEPEAGSDRSRSATQPSNPVRRQTITFRVDEINGKIPDEVFTLKYLEMPSTEMVRRTEIDGGSQEMVAKRGLVLPVDVARQFDPTAIGAVDQVGTDTRPATGSARPPASRAAGPGSAAGPAGRAGREGHDHTLVWVLLVTGIVVAAGLGYRYRVGLVRAHTKTQSTVMDRKGE